MSFTILDSIRHQHAGTQKDMFGLDVLTGFSSKPKFLASKYFYDAKGSELFKKITETKEYYPTRCEFEIFNDQKANIVGELPTEFSLIELGAGDGRKTRVLLKEMFKQKKKFEYLPIDISKSAIEEMTESFMSEYAPELKMHGVVGEYIEGLRWVKENRDKPKVVLFLGSNLGNFNETQAIVFLRTIWNSLAAGDIFIMGVDLKKDIDVMLDAYNDAGKVTSAFNLNVLTRINTELDANFDISKYQHFGTYNPKLGAMESYIISMEDQEVSIGFLKKKFRFKSFEPIHMEYSHKYSEQDIQFLAKETGFKIDNSFSDSKKYFTDFLFQVTKED
jgi:dimethylhistidine N-methyltransferase